MDVPILLQAGRVGRVGRAAMTELLLKQRKAIRAMVRKEDERAQGCATVGGRRGR